MFHIQILDALPSALRQKTKLWRVKFQFTCIKIVGLPGLRMSLKIKGCTPAYMTEQVGVLLRLELLFGINIMIAKDCMSLPLISSL